MQLKGHHENLTGHLVQVSKEVKVAIRYHNHPQPYPEQRAKKCLFKRLSFFVIWKDDYSGLGELSEVKNSAGDNTLFMMGWKLLCSEIYKMKYVCH